MPDIPPEIITIVLVRLPVKSLLRFRCVSKPWRSLIDGQDFIKLHLHHSAETNSNRTLLVSSQHIFSLDLDSLKRLDTGNTRFNPGSVIGCCNGLVSLRPGSYYNDVVFLWNPSTRKLNEFPSAPMPRECSEAVLCHQRYAFGYDSKHNDYKVVRAVQACHIMCSFSETMVFSLKTNSWKKALDFPYELRHCKTWGVYLNDALHSVADVAIMAFDLAKEEHYEVPKPDIIISSLGVIGGCLAAVVSGEKDMNSIDVWVMKEYGEKGSWCKFICFRHSRSWPCRTLCPLAFSKSGDEVLLNYGGVCLIWYNLGNKKFKMVACCCDGLSAFGDAMVIEGSSLMAWFCVASLVSPCSPCVVGD